MSRDWRLYANDILDGYEKVRRYMGGMDQSQLLNNDLVYDAVLRNIEMIGEAANRLPADVRQKMPDIDWQNVVGMRN